ncbi:MAG: protein-S-isoprenylcysteine O-methyltransferase [Pseudobdellovibrionaceae bacterium]
MSPWVGSIIFILGAMASIAIRIPHDKVSQDTKIVESRKGLLEKLLIGLVMIGMILFPVLSFTPILAFASYEPSFPMIVVGFFLMVASLWVFHRSHKDLGKNWSVSLEVREDHILVTNGIYKSVRHPMYTSILLLALVQIFLIPNWVAGPALLVAFSIMFFSRLHTEEKMMLDKFGVQYENYRQQTKRIIPGVW